MRPNLIFILADQLRWDALGVTGGWVKTPHLDALAAEGMLFRNCVTNSPTCVPARVSLATGYYPHNTGVWRNDLYSLPGDTPTWMRAVREAGYGTALIGKTHLHPDKLPGGRAPDYRDAEPLLHALGFDVVNEVPGPSACRRVLSHMTCEWREKGLLEAYAADLRSREAATVRPTPLPLEDYYDVYVGRKCREYLAGAPRDRPWMLCAHFPGPHAPWDTPPPYNTLHDPAGMPPPRRLERDCSGRPRGATDGRGIFDLTAERVAALRADYAGSVALIDEQIGGMFEEVRRRGEWDNTAVVFTSDHGEMNGDYGHLQKRTFYDGAVRVPLIVRMPGMAPGVSEAWIELFDLGPTLVELAGGSASGRGYAKSLVHLLRNPSSPHRTEAISELDREFMLMNNEWKLAINGDGRVYRLFDRVRDPLESRNLAGDKGYRGIGDRLRLRLLERVVESIRRSDRRGA